MEFFRIKKDIPFMRYAVVFNVISFITFLAAVFFLIVNGLHLSVEFTGGVVVESRYTQAANLESIRQNLRTLGVAEPQVQTFGSPNDILIRLALNDVKKIAAINNGKDQLDTDKFSAAVLKQDNQPIKITRVEYVGPQVGQELLVGGLKALALVIVGIILYLALRFEWKFAVAAVIANLHDVVIILGFFAAFQWEFSLAVLAAILAVLGYSVNESVVIADRIRENFRDMRHASIDEVIDNAITSTISRTMITHGLTELMVLSMLVFGGATLHYFAVALTIGILFGIYSSVLVMAPLTKWLGIKREDLIKPLKKVRRTDDDSGYEEGDFVGNSNDFENEFEGNIIEIDKPKATVNNKVNTLIINSTTKLKSNPNQVK
jgi:preprotein translocase subunit SecF